MEVNLADPHLIEFGGLARFEFIANAWIGAYDPQSGESGSLPIMRSQKLVSDFHYSGGRYLDPSSSDKNYYAMVRPANPPFPIPTLPSQWIPIDGLVSTTKLR